MWNRVALLIAGLTFGWTLVHYAAAAPDDRDRLRARLIVAAVVGGGLCAWLAVRDLLAALLGVAVFVATAAVGYAANCKQVNKAPVTLLPGMPRRGEIARNEAAVLLAVGGEPERYEGPILWARRLRERGPEAPHWLARPWAYGRVRTTYAGHAVLHESLAALRSAVAERLVGQEVRLAQVLAVEGLRPALLALAQEGYAVVVIVPVGVPPSLEPELREKVGLTRLREVGVRLEIVPPVAADWLGDPWARLDALLAGERPAPPQVSEALIQAIVAAAQP